MPIDPIQTPQQPAGMPDGGPGTARQAAEQFEQILVKQMVETMTKDLFDNGLAGDDAPQWLGAYGDMQSDVLSTELARRLTADGRLGIAELLMKQWAGQHSPLSRTEQNGDAS